MPQKAFDRESKSESERKPQFANYVDFLQAMDGLKRGVKSISRYKEDQIDFFIENIQQLSLAEIIKLSHHMMNVQNGTDWDQYFKMIRYERSRFYSLFNDEANTLSWQQLFHCVKEALKQKLYFGDSDQRPREAVYKKELSANDYDLYMEIMRFHSNRWYGRWGKTDSERAFVCYFERNPDLRNGEVRQSTKPTEAMEVSCVWNLTA